MAKLLSKYTAFLMIISLVFISCSQKGNNKANNDKIKISYKVINYPILKNKTNNSALRININNSMLNATLSKITANLKSTAIGNIKEIRFFYTGADSTFNINNQFGNSIKPQKEFSVEGKNKLTEGNNYIWITIELSENADITSLIDIKIDDVIVNGDNYSPSLVSESIKLRLGVAVRQHNQGSVHTYRIPGLATTNNGSLLAIYDVRRETGRDLQGNIDIGVSRSTNGGNSWRPMRIALDMGKWGGLSEKFNGVSDACILVDKKTNDIYIAGLWMHGVINSKGKWVEGLTENSKDWNHQWRNKGSQPGLGVKQTSQFLITKSSDDGKTWSKPINLTKMCKNPEWWLWAPAPGHGISLTDGTLVFPTQGRDKNGLPFSNITYSKDGGKTWKTSKPAYTNTTESMAVELNNGEIMLNMRDNRNRKNKSNSNGRAIAVTSDFGETWTEHPTSHGALIEPVCMASIHKHYYTDENGEKKSVILFSNPNSKFKRHKQTIKVSLDNGLSWPKKYWLELDAGRGAGYSCLSSIDENTIGILYEGSQAQMTFQAIKLNDLLQK